MDKNYELARRYCFKLDAVNHKDILHDAYLHWFKYKETNLFEQDNKLMILVLKRVFYKRLHKEKLYYKDGEYLPRVFTELESYLNIGIESDIYSELTTEKRLTDLIKILTSREKDILHYKLLGFNGEEIAVKLDTKPVLISYSLNQIKKKYKKLET